MAEFEADIEIDGKIHTITIEAPDEQSAEAFVNEQTASPQGLASLLQFAAESATTAEKGVLGKLAEALTIPEKLAREGLEQMADVVPERIGGGEPTGNLAADLALGAPRIAADTIAEAAPSFISRGALVTGGLLKGGQALKPLVKGAGGFIADTAESLSGIKHSAPGALRRAAGDPSLIFAPGKDAAGKAFESLGETIPAAFKATKDSAKILNMANKSAMEGTLNAATAKLALKHLGKLSKRLKGKPHKILNDRFQEAIKKAPRAGGKVPAELLEVDDAKQFVNDALDLVKSGEGNARTAFVARKVLDANKSSFPEPVYVAKRKILDAAAKKITSEADRGFVRGIDADALRGPLPLGKGGDPALLKLGIGSMVLPGIGGGMMIPALQGATATAVGAAARLAGKLGQNATRSGSSIGAILDLISGEERNRRAQ